MGLATFATAAVAAAAAAATTAADPCGRRRCPRCLRGKVWEEQEEGGRVRGRGSEAGAQAGACMRITSGFCWVKGTGAQGCKHLLQGAGRVGGRRGRQWVRAVLRQESVVRAGGHAVQRVRAGGR